jgi:DNA invertase Pin-like site-specific DNA recombinase
MAPVKARTDTIRVALYCRVSSAEQAEHGISLEEQRERLKVWAKTEDWQVAGYYIDEGISGGTDNRPELQRLMHDARAGAFNLVAVTKLDRFFRSTRLLLNYIHDLSELGISFVAQAESIDSRKPGMGNFIINLLGTVAEWERTRIGERVADFRNHLASQGRWSSGRTPYGYRFNKQTKQLDIYQPEAEAIRFLFTEYTSKHLGVIRLAEAINAAGHIPPRTHRRHQKSDFWTQTTVQHILKHPGYIGGPNNQWRFNTPAIIDTELWQRAQSQLLSNRHFKPSESGKTAFQGRLRCGLCGYTLRIGYNHNTEKVYECPGRLRRQHLNGSPRCTLPRFDTVEMDKRIQSQIDAIVANPATFRSHLVSTLKNIEAERKLLAKNLQSLEAEAAAVHEDMTVCDARLEMHRITPEVYKARIKQLQGKLNEIERRGTEADPCAMNEFTLKDSQVKLLQAILVSTDDGTEIKDLQTMAHWAGGVVDLNAPNHKLIKFVVESILERPASFFNALLVYPDRVEIKGTVVGNLNISPTCKNVISLPLSIKVACL